MTAVTLMALWQKFSCISDSLLSKSPASLYSTCTHVCLPSHVLLNTTRTTNFCQSNRCQIFSLHVLLCLSLVLEKLWGWIFKHFLSIWDSTCSYHFLTAEFTSYWGISHILKCFEWKSFVAYMAQAVNISSLL
jgi:hypothetical protein